MADVHRWRVIWRWIIVGGCLVMLATAPLPHNDTDSLFYGKAAKKMLSSGDWLTPTTDVPPLTIWLMALSLRLGGDSPAALRLWHILMTMALAAVTYRIARLAAPEEESLLAALLLLTTQQVLAWSLSPKQDIPLTLFLSLALYGYLVYRGSGRTGAALAAGFWAALAVLTKSPAALGVFVLIVGVDLLIAWRLSAPGHWRWGQATAGAGVFVLVAAPWFIYEFLHLGMPFLGTFFLQQSNAWRFVRGLDVPQPYGIGLIAYVPLVVVAVLPWSGLLPGAIREGWRNLRAGAPSLRLSFVWTLVIFIVLSVVPGTKSIRYLIPLYPPLAILGAHHLIKVLDTPSGLRLPAAVLAVLWLSALAAFGFGVSRDSPAFWIHLPLVVVFTPVVIGFLLAAGWGRGRLAVAILAVGTFTSLSVFAWASTREYAYRWLWPLRTAALQIQHLYRLGDRVLSVGEVQLTENSIVNYYLDGPEMVPTNEATLRRAWRQGGVFAILDPAVYRRVEADLHPVILTETPTGLMLVTNR